jgi:hypothetical protein
MRGLAMEFWLKLGGDAFLSGVAGILLDRDGMRRFSFLE